MDLKEIAKRALDEAFEKKGIEGIATAEQFKKDNPKVYRIILNMYGHHGFRRAVKDLKEITTPLIPGTDLYFEVVERSFIDYLRGLNEYKELTIDIGRLLGIRGIERSSRDIVIEQYKERIKKLEKIGPSSPLERKIDFIFHSTKRPDDIYLLHEHHVLYKDHVPETKRLFNCDFKIGRFWIEASDDNQKTPNKISESLKEKVSLYEDEIEIIIVHPKNKTEKILSQAIKEVMTIELKKLVGGDFFNFRDNYYTIEEPDPEEEFVTKSGILDLNDEKQRKYFKNRTAWWNRAHF